MVGTTGGTPGVLNCRDSALISAKSCCTRATVSINMFSGDHGTFRRSKLTSLSRASVQIWGATRVPLGGKRDPGAQRPPCPLTSLLGGVTTSGSRRSGIGEGTAQRVCSACHGDRFFLWLHLRIRSLLFMSSQTPIRVPRRGSLHSWVAADGPILDVFPSYLISLTCSVYEPVTSPITPSLEEDADYRPPPSPATMDQYLSAYMWRTPPEMRH